MADEMDQNTDLVQLPEKWADWKVVERIGTGSYGMVYYAVRGDEKCAIKVIQIPSDEAERSALLSESKNEGTLQQYLQDLIQNYTKEIQAMYALMDDPHIVRIMDHEIEELHPYGYRIYIQMELLTSLRKYFAGRNVSESEAIKIGLDICDALTACEKQHIIHRDIKPDNIFRSIDGTYKLGDFGTVRQMDLTFATYSAKGTFSYMAPEVYKGERYNRQVDIYSLGIVLYRLMNRNRDPFLDPLKQLVFYQEREDALRSRMEGMPIPAPIDASEKFTRVICKACAYRAEDRYENAASLKADLEKVENPDSVITTTDKTTEDNQGGTVLKTHDKYRRIRTIRRAGALLAVFAAFGLGTGTYFYKQRNRQAGIAEQPVTETEEHTKGRTTESAAPNIKVIGDKEEGFVPFRSFDHEISEGMQEALAASDELVETLSDCAFTDRELFDSYFMNASEEQIDEYYIDFRKYNDYPYSLKIPVAESNGVFLVSYVRYMDSEQTETSGGEEWSKGFRLLMTKAEDTWKITLDEEAKAEIGEILLEGAFPEGFADALRSECPNRIMEDHNNYMYLSPEAVYENCYSRQVRFIWQEDGDVLVSILFTNASDQIHTFRNLRLKLNDKQLGSVIDVRLPREIFVETGKNVLCTYRIDASEVITGMDLWKDVSANIVEGSFY